MENPEPEYWADGQHQAPEAPSLVITENSEMGRLYGPDGKLIKIIRSKADLSFGFGKGSNAG